MTIRIIRTASLGLPVGTFRTLAPATEAALVADKEAVYDGPQAGLAGPVTADASGNLFANGRQIQGSVSGYGIPKSLRACIPGRDPSTSFLDVSGNSATLAVDAGNTGAFATADYFSSIAGNTTGLVIAAAKTLWTPASQSMILAFVVKKAVPGASQNLCAWGGSVGAGGLGFYLSHRVTTGAIKIVPIVAAAVVNAQADSTLAFSDATPQDRHCVIAYDAPSGSWYIYRDGVLSNAFLNQMVGANAYPAATATTLGFRWGSTADATPGTVVAATGYGLQAYVIDGGLPVNIGLIAAKLAATPRSPVSSLDLA